MSDTLKLTEVARAEGFQVKIGHFLQKKAAAVLDIGGAPADLALAKSISYSGAPDGDQLQAIVDRFSQMIVTVTVVADALAATTPAYDHRQFADASFETQVNSLWDTYVKAVI